MHEPRTFAEIALSCGEVFELTRECPAYTFVGLTITMGFSFPGLVKEPHEQWERAYYVSKLQDGERGGLQLLEGPPLFNTSVKLRVNPEFGGMHTGYLNTNYGFTGIASPINDEPGDIVGKPVTLNTLIARLRSMDKEKPTYILRGGAEWPIIGAYYIHESGGVILQALVNEYAYQLT